MHKRRRSRGTRLSGEELLKTPPQLVVEQAGDSLAKIMSFLGAGVCWSGRVNQAAARSLYGLCHTLVRCLWTTRQTDANVQDWLAKLCHECANHLAPKRWQTSRKVSEYCQRLMAMAEYVYRPTASLREFDLFFSSA